MVRHCLMNRVNDSEHWPILRQPAPGVRSVVKIGWQTIRQIDLTDEKKFVAYLSIRGGIG
jgi:hypothetical protein